MKPDSNLPGADARNTPLASAGGYLQAEGLTDAERSALVAALTKPRDAGEFQRRRAGWLLAAAVALVAFTSVAVMFRGPDTTHEAPGEGALLRIETKPADGTPGQVLSVEFHPDR